MKRMTDTLPVMPGEEDPSSVDARRADALVAVCSSRLADDADPIEPRWSCTPGSATSRPREGRRRWATAGRIHPETARRLMCDSRVQTVIEDEEGEPLRLGRMAGSPLPR